MSNLAALYGHEQESAPKLNGPIDVDVKDRRLGKDSYYRGQLFKQGEFHLFDHRADLIEIRVETFDGSSCTLIPASSPRGSLKGFDIYFTNQSSSNWLYRDSSNSSLVVGRTFEYGGDGTGKHTLSSVKSILAVFDSAGEACPGVPIIE